MSLDEKLDRLFEELTKIEANIDAVTRALGVVEANSRLVVAQVEEHGGMIAHMERRLARVSVHCPIIKQDAVSSVSGARVGAR